MDYLSKLFEKEQRKFHENYNSIECSEVVGTERA